MALINTPLFVKPQTEFTDIGLADLHGLPQLELLDLDGTQVTDAGIDELKQKLLNCRIFN